MAPYFIAECHLTIHLYRVIVEVQGDGEERVHIHRVISHRSCTERGRERERERETERERGRQREREREIESLVEPDHDMHVRPVYL